MLWDMPSKYDLGPVSYYKYYKDLFSIDTFPEIL